MSVLVILAGQFYFSLVSCFLVFYNLISYNPKHHHHLFTTTLILQHYPLPLIKVINSLKPVSPRTMSLEMGTVVDVGPVLGRLPLEVREEIYENLLGRHTRHEHNMRSDAVSPLNTAIHNALITMTYSTIKRETAFCEVETTPWTLASVYSG